MDRLDAVPWAARNAGSMYVRINCYLGSAKKFTRTAYGDEISVELLKCAAMVERRMINRIDVAIYTEQDGWTSYDPATIRRFATETMRRGG